MCKYINPISLLNNNPTDLFFYSISSGFKKTQIASFYYRYMMRITLIFSRKANPEYNLIALIYYYSNELNTKHTCIGKNTTLIF